MLVVAPAGIGVPDRSHYSWVTPYLPKTCSLVLSRLDVLDDLAA